MLIRLFAVLLVGGVLVSSAAVAADKLPKPGTEFKFLPDAPKYVTADIEFRDPSGEKWPNFFYGKPGEAGRFVYDAIAPSGTMFLKCDKGSQLKGEQDRRIVGELIVDEKSPEVSFRVKSFGAPVKEKVERIEKGKPVTKEVELLPVEGELAINGKSRPVKAKAQVKYNVPKNAETPDSLYMDIRFMVSGKDLGMKSTGSTGDIEVRVGITGFIEPPGKKK